MLTKSTMQKVNFTRKLDALTLATPDGDTATRAAILRVKRAWVNDTLDFAGLDELVIRGRQVGRDDIESTIVTHGFQAGTGRRNWIGYHAPVQ